MNANIELYQLVCGFILMATSFSSSCLCMASIDNVQFLQCVFIVAIRRCMYLRRVAKPRYRKLEYYTQYTRFRWSG
jgi:hypothetical protein